MKLGIISESGVIKPYITTTEDVFSILEQYDEEIVISKPKPWIKCFDENIDYLITIKDDFSWS